ncbi:hypothetical protein FKP32DRAFT_1047690 [Trametes sanguinea]|nr:hypothetical protein FKP32DRAFT_1047690 [Trametes sanguinea]
MEYCSIVDGAPHDLVPSRSLHRAAPGVTPQTPTLRKMQYPHSYPSPPSSTILKPRYPRSEPLPNRPHVVYFPSSRNPGPIYPPISFVSKPGRPRIALADALERGPRLLSNILAVEDNETSIFRSGLKTIKLKINWPGYADYTRQITLPRGRATGNLGCVALLTAIADAYDEFIKSKKTRGVSCQCTDPYWSISSNRDRYHLGNLVPLALRHFGSDVFQLDVELFVRSTMQ